MQISSSAARQLMITTQGLNQLPNHSAQKEDVLTSIRRMGALQIDTIHVVARSPYLVLWSRLGEYEQAWLDELLAEGRIFEYWSHAACFLPVEDYGLYRRVMLEGRRGWYDNDGWLHQHAEMVAAILARIRAEGPLRSSDFETTNKQPGGWWNWKEEKIALEHLHTSGQLMIARRVNFQRCYDLQERVLPGWDDNHAPIYDEVVRQFVLRTVFILGICQAAWVADYFRLPKRRVPAVLEALTQEGLLLPVEVEGWKTVGYVHTERSGLLEQAAAGELACDLTTFLSPFDPLIWDRARTKAIFDFDYTIEVYTPQAKRRFGYYVLPILQGDRLIGRLDPKAHRKEGLMEIKAVGLEAGVEVTPDLARGIAEALLRFATWHRTPQLKLGACQPEDLRAELLKFLPGVIE